MDTVVLKITNLLFIYNFMQISLMYEFCEKIKIKHVPLLCMYFNHEFCILYKNVGQTALKIIKNYCAVKYTYIRVLIFRPGFFEKFQK